MKNLKKQSITLLFATMLLLGFGACSDDDENVRIPIHSVQATASLNVSSRANWHFYVNNNPYRFTINDRLIVACAKSKNETSYVVTKGVNSGGGYVQEENVMLWFVHPEYHLLKKNEAKSVARTSPPLLEEQLDQSTLDKLRTVDGLTARYVGAIYSNLENVKLVHAHDLIKYTFEGLPEGATPVLKCHNGEVKPYVSSGGLHHAILVDYRLVDVGLKIGEKVYTKNLGLVMNTLPVEKRATQDMRYSFVVKYNNDEADDSKKLSIEDLEGLKWSEVDQK